MSDDPLPRARRGTCSSDPYRWIEEDTAERRAWVTAHQDHAARMLSNLPARRWLHGRLDALFRVRGAEIPVSAGGRWFLVRRADEREVAALYRRDRLSDEWRLLFDPVAMGPDGAAIADIHPSPDGSRIAVRISVAGSSLMPLLVLDGTSGAVLADTVPGEVNPAAHVWHTPNRVAWLADSSGFYYTRCPCGTRPAERRIFHRLFRHDIGADWRADPMVFGADLVLEEAPFPRLSADGRYLLALVQDLSGARPRSRLYLRDEQGPERGFVPICPQVDGFMEAAMHNGTLYIRTDHAAPLCRILAVDLAAALAGAGRMDLVIAEGAGPIGAWTVAGDWLVVDILEGACSHLRVHRLDGAVVGEVALPDKGTVSHLEVLSPAEVQVSFSSFLVPGCALRLPLDTLEPVATPRRAVPFEAAEFQTEQVWFPSRDGTEVPMFLVHRRDVRPDGGNPAVLHAYGGFGVCMTPKFTPHALPFLERGGIYAVVCARGGGEFGEAWHRAGSRRNKQNTFDDLNAAAHWLVDQGYADPGRIGSFGWSNGGLTVTAAALQRPDLWSAVVAGAPVTDMARFDTAHSGRLWTGDYGSPQDPEDLEQLLRYSPYHALSAPIDGPALLTVVPDGDDRVAPWHGYKLHAAWCEADVSSNPVLLRGEAEAGHRGAAAHRRNVERYADIWAFLFWQLGMDCPPPDA